MRLFAWERDVLVCNENNNNNNKEVSKKCVTLWGNIGIRMQDAQGVTLAKKLAQRSALGCSYIWLYMYVELVKRLAGGRAVRLDVE